MQKKKSRVKKCLEICAIKGGGGRGGVGRLMAKTILNFHFDYWNPSLTKGNSNVLNIDSKRGSVGFTSVLLPSVYPVSIIRVDEQVLSSQPPFFALNIL